jgi:hypothetical protein
MKQSEDEKLRLQQLKREIEEARKLKKYLKAKK